MNAFEFDASRCSGCWACTMTCVDQNDLRLTDAHDAYRLVSARERSETGERIFSWRMDGCMHCADPACAKVCPRDCFSRNADGLVLLRGENCVGCGLCARACPYNAIRIAGKKAHKCNGCAERVAAGLRPACERICPSGALQFHPQKEICRESGKNTIQTQEEPR